MLESVSEFSTGHAKRPLFCREGEADRSVDRVFETLAQQHHVRSSKTIVLEACQHRVAVHVRPAKGRLKIERHNVSGGRNGLREKESQPDGSASIHGS